MDKANALFSKAKRQIGGKTQIGGDEEYVNHVNRFKEVEHKVKDVAENLKKYEKAILAITPALEKLSQSLVDLYNEEEVAVYGKEFANSATVVSEAVRNFQNEQASVRQELDDYLSRISTMKKNIQADEDLYTSMKDKEKTAQKGGKNANVATEKYQATKESYESKHEEVASQLTAFMASRHTDFESKFLAIVQAQKHLFSRMSDSFSIESLGLAETTKHSITPHLDPPPRSTPENDNSPRVISPRPAITPRPALTIPSHTPAPTIPGHAPVIPGHAAPVIPGHAPAPTHVAQTSMPSRPPMPNDRKPSFAPVTANPVPERPGAPGRPTPPGRPSHYTLSGKLAIIPDTERAQFEDNFINQVGNASIMTGSIAFDMLSKSGLHQDQLALIWELSDQDKDGNLTMEEFTLAMYLVNAKINNRISEIPASLPPEYTITPPVLQ